MIRTLRSMLVGCACLTLGVVEHVQAQDGALYVVTYIEVAPGAAAQGAALMKRFAAAGRADRGNQRFEALQRAAPSNQFVLVGTWSDAKAFEAHQQAAHTRQFAVDIQPHLIAPFDVRLHGSLSVSAAEAARAPDGKAVVIVSHVDVPPPSKDKCVEALQDLVTASRKEAGNARFEVFQQSSRPNHFSVVEVWRSEADYLAHIIAARTRLFRDQLGPMTGALYDERRYLAF